MKSSLGAIEQLAINQIISNGFPLMGKSKIGLGLMAISVMLLLIAIALFLISGHIWFASEFPAELATFYTAGLVLLVAIICGAIAALLSHYRTRKMDKVKAEMMINAEEIFTTMHKEVDGTIKENPKTALAMAAMAGIIFAKKI